jgi:RHS repeat-associated protein
VRRLTGSRGQVSSETDPGNITKTYGYAPGGTRLFQTTTGNPVSSLNGTAYYSYNNHSDVQALTGPSGTPTATYGYTAYGSPVASMFTGADKTNTSPGPNVVPYSSYRFNAMQWDPGSGQYNMGFRNYDPSLNQFISRDMYNGALADMDLTADPFTGSRYAFGNGNLISNIELDGHMPCIPGGPCGSIQALSRYELTAELNALKDAALSALSAAFKAQQPQEPSLGSMICQALLDLCQLPKAIANIPRHIPSELKQFGDLWLQQWKSGWSNKIQYSAQAGSIFVTTPRGVTYKVPGHWVSRTANNGKGIVFQDPKSIGTGNGNQNMIRIMEPTAQNPNGYVRVYNQYGQPVGYNSLPGPNADTHIPEEEPGPFPELPIEP